MKGATPVTTSTITSKGQTTIPKEIRDRLGLHPGDKIDFVIDADGQLVVKPRTVHVRDLFGILKPKDGRVATLEDMERAIIAGAMDSMK